MCKGKESSESKSSPPVECPEDGTAAIAIEYPQEEETVDTAESIFFKIKTNVPVSQVEISIDDNDWLPCRESGGYWWFAWSGFLSRWHTVHARAYGHDGAVHLSRERTFVAKINV